VIPFFQPDQGASFISLRFVTTSLPEAIEKLARASQAKAMSAAVYVDLA
jgi:hypothetical protein